MHAESDPFRFCVRSDDVEPLDRALTYALSSWTLPLTTGQLSPWADYAATAHRLRNGLTSLEAGAHCV